MKIWRIIGLLAILIIGTVLMSGCLSPGSTSTAPVTANPTFTVSLTQTRTLTPTPTPSPTPALKTVLFSDDLSRWRSEWESEYDDTNGKTSYSGGSLHIRDNDPPRKAMYHILNKNFNDFILDVDTKFIAGTDDNYQGVRIRRQDIDNQYILSISADGYYTIMKAEKGNLIDLAEPTRSSYIKTGIGATNHIQVEANKNTLSLSVNGHHLSTVTDNAFKVGTVSLSSSCLTSGSFTEVAFSNLIITTL